MSHPKVARRDTQWELIYWSCMNIHTIIQYNTIKRNMYTHIHTQVQTILAMIIKYNKYQCCIPINIILIREMIKNMLQLTPTIFEHFLKEKVIASQHSKCLCHLWQQPLQPNASYKCRSVFDHFGGSLDHSFFQDSFNFKHKLLV